MLLVALVSVGGFTVLAQRRLRSIGLIESIGATDRHVRLVVRANGTVVGLAGAVGGLVLGLVVWLAYRPSLEQSSHHLIGVFALQWVVVAAAMVLAVLAALYASSRPARAIARIPIVVALSGRPAPPRQIRRSATPGIVFLVVAFLLLGYSGSTNKGNGSGGAPELVFGIVLLVPGLILLAPFFLSATATLASRLPVAPRLALRDLGRYRARSGSALAAISLGILVAVIVMLAAASRYGNVIDYAGPNLASNQLALHGNTPPPTGTNVVTPKFGLHVQKNAPGTIIDTTQELAVGARSIAKDLGAQLIDLESTNANLVATQGGRSWSGQIYVATPQLLRAFGITASEIDPNADVLSSRPGLSGASGLEFTFGTNNGQTSINPGTQRAEAPRCSAATDCLAHPVIQEVGALPTGTSAPNTVITEHAVRKFHLQVGHDRLVGPGHATLQRGADRQRAARRVDHPALRRVEERSTELVDRHRLGDGLRHRDRPGCPGHVGRPGTERDGGGPSDPHGRRSEQLHQAHALGRHRRGARVPRRAPRDPRGVHRAHWLAPRQFVERWDLVARERPRR